MGTDQSSNEAAEKISEPVANFQEQDNLKENIRKIIKQNESPVRSFRELSTKYLETRELLEESISDIDLENMDEVLKGTFKKRCVKVKKDLDEQKRKLKIFKEYTTHLDELNIQLRENIPLVRSKKFTSLDLNTLRNKYAKKNFELFLRIGGKSSEDSNLENVSYRVEKIKYKKVLGEIKEKMEEIKMKIDTLVSVYGEEEKV